MVEIAQITSYATDCDEHGQLFRVFGVIAIQWTRYPPLSASAACRDSVDPTKPLGDSQPAGEGGSGAGHLYKSKLNDIIPVKNCEVFGVKGPRAARASTTSGQHGHFLIRHHGVGDG